MTRDQDPLELFYSYAPQDDALRARLDNHLALLRQQGLIRTWHAHDISAGNLWASEIEAHLQAAQLILLLISPDFLASDYCYGTEMQAALQRHGAGTARVIPILLRPCDLDHVPFAQLQVLPRNGKAVTMWTNRDAAFTEIAREIRQAIEASHGDAPETVAATTTRKRRGRDGEATGTGGGTISAMSMMPTMLNAPALKKAVTTYHKKLDEFKGKAEHEMALRSAFQELLAETARQKRWTLVPELTIDGGIRPDGVVLDGFNLRRGYWEAKGPKSELEREIKAKIAAGYPLTNTIFENTVQAVLYQSKRRVPTEYDLRKPNDVSDLLKQFFTYTEPDIENFEAAVIEFKERIPELAGALLKIIAREHKENKRFTAASEGFSEICRSALDPQISATTIDEMLVQHLLTERLFRTVFDNPDFVRRNVIAAEIEKVIDALASRSFNRHEFLKSLDRFYVAIEGAAKGINNWSERQHFLNTVYERFFQGFSIKQADTHGIVYTPQEIVDFMCASVEEVLRREFGSSIAEQGVQILDPATGTGNFIVNLIRNYIPRHQLKYKYDHDLFCNEIMLLPYYIASLNIEHEYYEKMGTYEPFEGICFADTLSLAEGQQLSLFVEENTERVKREKEAQIMVVIGNPPYNAKQMNENDNNKNRRYPIIDQRIRETYLKDSTATLNNMLYDAYARFFRWATDRLQGRDGIVCFVSNNSFIDQAAFSGMRKHLLQDFTQIYLLDLHGNVRKNPKLSGTTHNVFGIKVGVSITIAVRASQNHTRKLYYYRVPEFWRKTEKLAFLTDKGSILGIVWQELQPSKKNIWLTEGLHSEFLTFLPIGTKEAKSSSESGTSTIFRLYSGGVKSNRDTWVYDFNRSTLIEKIRLFIETYNGEVDRWNRRGRNDTRVDDFVTYDDKRIKWSENLKAQLIRKKYISYSEHYIRRCLYRPFTKVYLYFDPLINDRRLLQHIFFTNPINENENSVICLTDIASEKPFMVMITNIISDLHLVSAGSNSQCFPYYTYTEDGSNRRENITDWALAQFQGKYGPDVTKWDIFHYVYGMLHHPQYRERYAENLKRDLPHIPLLHRSEAFRLCVRIGRELMELHLNYEQAKEYKLEWLHNKDVPFSWHVEKMRLSTDRRVVVVNESLRLGPLPPECFEYRLGNRSALEWVIDQYQVSEDKRSGIVSDPNRFGDEEDYIVRLVCRVVTVSVETVRLVGELAQGVTLADWMEEGETRGPVSE